ncbi:SDR family NAD(P)-dependent oxidoreductase [Ktedonobacter robiniae]|uniref:Beta-ketoacyl-ACP reductase n=1 Tax=Ktedonobacter robiniae TaxID=2778365 RepID=A0ABQ3UUE3_9CHLR|nr:SDR family oxidoreductase [Ktedonobacter robiniae]GHO56207.1 beta-ketoacyl-ACP reductase [Ktedonobacter robiniae]
MNLNGKIAIVTGGSRGIGSATSKLLAQRGAKVIVNYLSNETAASSVVADIRTNGGEAVAFQADVREEAAVDALVQFTQATFGAYADILVNNANIPFQFSPFAEASWEGFALKVNEELKAAFLLTKAVLPSMIAQHTGRIIYLSAGPGTYPMDGLIAHGTAKGALDTFARYIAHEFGPLGVTVNVIAPSLTETDATAFLPEQVKQTFRSFTPLRRMGQPDDVAHVIAFLASDDSRFLTGTYTPVDGGFTMDVYSRMDAPLPTAQ